jgi:hypothetical protein
MRLLDDGLNGERKWTEGKHNIAGVGLALNVPRRITHEHTT